MIFIGVGAMATVEGIVGVVDKYLPVITSQQNVTAN